MYSNVGLDYNSQEFIKGTTKYQYARSVKTNTVKFVETETKKNRDDEKNPLQKYNEKLPLIGLSYVYKSSDLDKYSYFCALCNMSLRAQSYEHIVGNEHIFKYIERHFPKLSKQVEMKLENIGDRNIDIKLCKRDIFRKLYRKIEEQNGKRKVKLFDRNDFSAKTRRRLSLCPASDHYNENTITITDVEVDDLIENCKNKKLFIDPDLISLKQPGYHKTFIDKKTESQTYDKEKSDRTRRKRRDDDRYDDDTEDSWNKYFHIIEREMEYLNQEYCSYEDFSKKHPNYESEYQKYNNEIQHGGGDIRDIKLKWNLYWKNCLPVFYEDDVQKLKQRIKGQLGLRLNVRTPSPTRRKGDEANEMQGNNFLTNNYENQRDVGSKSGSTMTSKNYDHQSDTSCNNGEIPSIQEKDTVGVIFVLRLFDSIQSELGSLGPQVVQLLNKAVTCKKNGLNPDSLMIMDKDYYIFFVTATEKLKGQCIAKLIPANLMNTVETIIKDSATLIEMFEKFCKCSGNHLPNMSGSSIINKNISLTGGNAGIHSSDQRNSRPSSSFKLFNTSYFDSSNSSGVSSLDSLNKKSRWN